MPPEPMIPPAATPAATPPAAAAPAAPAPAAAAPPAAPAPAAAAPAATPPAAPAPAAAPTTILTDPALAPAAAPAAPAPAAAFSVKFPEGTAADSPLVKEFTTLATDLKLDSASGQKIVDLYSAEQKRQVQAHVDQVVKWAEEAKADPDLSKDWKGMTSSAAKALARFGSDGLRDLLTRSGLGNHKDVIKMFANVGKLISEDRLVDPTRTAPPTAPAKSRDEQIKELWPNSPGMLQNPS